MPEVIPFPSPGAPPHRRGGRPKIDPDALRRITLGVRVSATEYAAVRAKAEQMGLTPAQWLREAALSRPLPRFSVPTINRSEYAELARLAANLNQLAHHANAGQLPEADALQRLLMATRAEVGRLRYALLGMEPGA